MGSHERSFATDSYCSGKVWSEPNCLVTTSASRACLPTEIQTWGGSPSDHQPRKRRQRHHSPFRQFVLLLHSWGQIVITHAPPSQVPRPRFCPPWSRARKVGAKRRQVKGQLDPKSDGREVKCSSRERWSVGSLEHGLARIFLEVWNSRSPGAVSSYLGSIRRVERVLSHRSDACEGSRRAREVFCERWGRRTV